MAVSLIMRWRVILALAGLAVLLASATLLAYTFWPTRSEIEQFEPPATLFAPPQSRAAPEPWQ